MRNSSILGLCFIVLGVMMAINGYQAHRWFLLGAGVMAIISGAIRMLIPRPSRAPAP